MSPGTFKDRVGKIIEALTYGAFNFCRRGLFEIHKTTVITLLTLRIMLRAE